MKLYTKTGDKGTTALFSGERIPKYNERINLYGTLDELSSILIIALEFEPSQKIKSDLQYLVHLIFRMCSDFATIVSSTKSDAFKRINEEDISIIEHKIDEYSELLPILNDFIVPGGTKCSAFINQARTICRRAERIAASLATTEKLNESALRYLNRLADFLFVAMRLSASKE